MGIDHLQAKVQGRTDFDLKLKLDRHSHKPWGSFVEPYHELLDLAELFRSHEATDPRDKIYALLGLATVFATDRVVSRIDVDYTISTSDLFLKTARRIASAPGLLGLLRSAGASARRHPDLPSWVPDWSCSSNIRPLSDLCAGYFLLDQKPMIYNHMSPRVLKVAGRQVDTICAVGEIMETTSKDQERDILKRWRYIAREHSARNFECFNWRGLSFSQRKARLTIENAYLDQKIQICTGRRYFVGKQNLALDTRLKGTAAPPGIVIRSNSMYNMFTTRNVGVAPAQAEAGDALVLIPGAQLPFVLRPEKDMYSLIGECYIDGVNLNELMGKDKNAMKTFCLK